MTAPLPPKRRKAREALPFDVLDLDGLRDDFAAGRARQVGVVARRLLATLDAVLSSQGMVRASIESAHATALDAARADARGLREALRWIAAQSCRRDAPCFELSACVTEKCETCYARAALANGGAR